MSAHPDPRVATWQPPPPLPAGRPGDIPGALGGSRLFDQPRYRAEAEAWRAFLAPPGPVALEIGFDHGDRLAALAAADPHHRWAGLEIRRARVESLAARAPANLFVWRADARTVLRQLTPEGRLDRVDILFPTPWWDTDKRARRLLLTEAFIADLALALAPDGRLHLATDVAPYFTYITQRLAAWRPAHDPPEAPCPSRRERSCALRRIPIHRGTWSPPAAPLR